MTNVAAATIARPAAAAIFQYLTLAFHFDDLAGEGGAHGLGVRTGVEIGHPAFDDLTVGRPGMAVVDHVRLAPRLGGCTFGVGLCRPSPHLDLVLPAQFLRFARR